MSDGGRVGRISTIVLDEEDDGGVGGGMEGIDHQGRNNLEISAKALFFSC